MRYFLIAGEPSGDLHGANLMRGLQRCDPEAEFRFWGGDNMATVGGVDNLGLHYRESSFFGLANVFLNLRTIARQLKMCQEQIREFKPDVVILIDYAGFNLRIAKFAKSIGLKVFYYIAPKTWAWDEKRLNKLRRDVDELFIIFPFEREYFRKNGIEAHFEGNPLVDAIATRCQSLPSCEEFAKQNNLDSRPIIALLAGSRATEIKSNLPIMRGLAEIFPTYQFVVAGVDWLSGEIYEKILAGSSIRYVEGQTYELLKHSEAAVVTSGTATLETALIGVPQVVLYRVPWIQKVLFPIVIKIPFISLVNINLGRESVREILQVSADSTEVAEELRAVMCGGVKREQILADYEELRVVIGEVGASCRFAQRMVEILSSKG